MFSRVAGLIVCGLAVASQVYGHSVVSPAMGVAGAPVRKDAQRTGRNPCGRVDVAENLDSSQTITPNADGSITMTINNFNPGLDGSRQIRKAMLDSTGTGNSFNTPVTITKNGAARAQTRTGSEQITVQMPAGVQCTGGASGDLCVMSFTTLSGFGNCVVVQQQQGGAAGNAGNTGAGGATGQAGGATGQAGAGTATGATGASTGTGATGATGATGNTNTNTGSTGTNGGATGGEIGAQTGTATNQGANTNGGVDTTPQLPANGATTGQTGATTGTNGNASNGRVRRARNIGGSRAPRALINGCLDDAEGCLADLLNEIEGLD